ncbi:hypothetical protein A0H81_08607 [Grifola frondosa]|uniref:L domain-like protein n=1 Tax=Grifola frondosa TaxID=5627 RepID=A0A1C7M4L6_GRIFR|nr:hypothetical protein A0H81_08607 [Grifola frondosa]
MSEACYNLVYLELAACRLTVLPPDLARAIPNVRVLNLNYNFLDDPRPLEGLTRLRKLTIIGSRIKAAKQIVRVLRGMKDVEMLDFRMNPCTLGWYLPLLVKDVPGALQPSDGERPFGASGPQGRAEAPRADPGSAIGPPPSREEATPGAGTRGGEQATWRELDAKFRRDLPNEAYVGRLAYRGLVMRACPAVRMLDGVEVERKEREKAEMLLKEVLERRKAQG